jgi:hypothetical protein
MQKGALQPHCHMKDQLSSLIEIYYETSVHKKFLTDLYAVIPKGRKCVMWFAHNKCWLFKIAKRAYIQGSAEAVQYDDVRAIRMPLANAEWYAGQGTVLYGTCISEKRNDVQRRFSVENVYFLCGVKQPNNGTLGRFTALFNAYENDPNHQSCQFQLWMPIMHTNFNDAVRDALAVTTYDVFCIQHRFLHRASCEFKNLAMHLASLTSLTSLASLNVNAEKATSTATISTATISTATKVAFFPKQANIALMPNLMQSKPRPNPNAYANAMQTRTFVIRPDAQNDIYYVLHRRDEPIMPNTMIAHIPNYKTSVMMNALFRNIKENRNLDALEESDDEEEELTPLVDLNKCMPMLCAFNHRFKRWQPVGLQPV